MKKNNVITFEQTYNIKKFSNTLYHLLQYILQQIAWLYSYNNNLTPQFFVKTFLSVGISQGSY